jgi:hypothetical protein
VTRAVKPQPVKLETETLYPELQPVEPLKRGLTLNPKLETETLYPKLQPVEPLKRGLTLNPKLETETLYPKLQPVEPPLQRGLSSGRRNLGASPAPTPVAGLHSHGVHTPLAGPVSAGETAHECTLSPKP